MSAPFIFYHKVADPPPDARIRGGYTPVRRFAKQMAFLRKQGFILYTASEMIEHLREHGTFPEKGIAVTFDDGWKDNYLNAFPVMRKLGMKATIFLIPSCIGKISNKALSEGEHSREHLSEDDILEMSKHGIEFGSHTQNHKLLHQIPADEVRFEVGEYGLGQTNQDGPRRDRFLFQFARKINSLDRAAGGSFTAKLERTKPTSTFE